MGWTDWSGILSPDPAYIAQCDSASSSATTCSRSSSFRRCGGTRSG
jgi:hypothetical protein